MEYRKLGKTGLEVSIVGYGASPLGAVFAPVDAQEGRRAVRQAIEAGINYFDTSPYYGDTLSETRLGEALEDVRDQVILATKVGRYGGQRFDFSAPRVTRSVDESLARLRTDRIDVIQVHDMEFGDLDQVIEETVPALLRLKESGKVRFVGVTGYPLTALTKVCEAANVDTVLTYCRYNLMDTTMDAMLLPAAKGRGLGLINASPLHMRLLTDSGAPDWHPAPARVVEAAARAAELCRSRGVDIADLAMAFALRHPDVATTLVGMSKTRHVEANVGVLDMEIDPDLLQAVQAVLAPAKDVYWKSGRPENDDPGAVDQRA